MRSFIGLLALGACAESEIHPNMEVLEREAAEQGLERVSTATLVRTLRDEIALAGVEPTPAAPVVSGPMFALGQALAFDKELSGNRDVSCMTCHHPALGSDDDRSLPIGVHGTGLGADRVHPTDVRIPRNAPALFNLHAMPVMFWDGRVTEVSPGAFTSPAGSQLTADMQATMDFGAASVQAMFPVTSREEMRGQPGENELADLGDTDFTGIWSAIMTRLEAIPEYTLLFGAAYPGVPWSDLTFAHAANAIAAFEVAAFAATESPWERFLQGDDGALSRIQLQGAITFFDSGCAQCHSGVGLSDLQFHNTLLAQIGPGKGAGGLGDDDYGHEAVSGLSSDRYKFRTPPLTNVGYTAPYGHDGQYEDLSNFLLHYQNPSLRLRRYSPSTELSDAALWSMQCNNVRDVLANPDPALATVDARYRNSLLVFLATLDDPASADLFGFIPGRVPSGAEVEFGD